MQNCKRYFAVLLMGLAGLAGAAQNGGESEKLTAEQARDVVARFLESAESYQADFRQQLQSAAGETLEEEAGSFWLQRPGKFRWHYTDPWEREIIAADGTVWLYDAELEQVTVRPVEAAMLKSPAALLAGDLLALNAYEFSGQKQAAGDSAIRLVPLEQRGDFTAVGLGFSPAGGLIRLELEDRFEQRTIITFSKIQLNAVLPPDIFEFTMPDGVDVIDQRVGQAE
jgi:outer membrane lipoprotein carrier protein